MSWGSVCAYADHVGDRLARPTPVATLDTSPICRSRRV
jgi:hypothetical protein